MHIFNFPCTVKNSPSLILRGHGSHVANVRFMNEDSMLVSVGSRDRAIILWTVKKRSMGKPVYLSNTWHGTSRKVSL